MKDCSSSEYWNRGRSLGTLLCLIGALLVPAAVCRSQDASAASKPAERIIGSITGVDAGAHTVTVKEDKSGTEYKIQLQNARTLLKVEPTAKDLSKAVRITADDLTTGDRVQIGGAKSPEDPNTVVARSVILMSGRELQQVHQAQAAEWQGSTSGLVTGVDAASGKLNVTARTPEGPKPMVVDISKAQLTRYTPDSPKIPAASQISEIQPGDQVRIIGEKSGDGSTITATRLYSSSFRNIVASVTSVSPDGKSITVRDLQTKQPVVVTLTDDSAVRKLPQMMAYMLARRFNPDFKPPQGADREAGATNGPGAPPYGAKGGEAAGGPGGRPGNAPGEGGGPGRGPGGNGPRGNGDLSQMLERLPKISPSDLKAGDAVVISGSPTGSDKSHLVGLTIIAGVEPIFQSSPRRAQSLGDWGASLGGGADAGMPPQ